MNAFDFHIDSQYICLVYNLAQLGNQKLFTSIGTVCSSGVTQSLLLTTERYENEMESSQRRTI